MNDEPTFHCKILSVERTNVSYDRVKHYKTMQIDRGFNSSSQWARTKRQVRFELNKPVIAKKVAILFALGRDECTDHGVSTSNRLLTLRLSAS